jgi:hypothetical protein
MHRKAHILLREECSFFWISEYESVTVTLYLPKAVTTSHENFTLSILITENCHKLNSINWIKTFQKKAEMVKSSHNDMSMEAHQDVTIIQ